MRKVTEFCDICGNELEVNTPQDISGRSTRLEFGDMISWTIKWSAIMDMGDSDNKIDICLDCIHKLIGEKLNGRCKIR